MIALITTILDFLLSLITTCVKLKKHEDRKGHRKNSKHTHRSSGTRGPVPDQPSGAHPAPGMLEGPESPEAPTSQVSASQLADATPQGGPPALREKKGRTRRKSITETVTRTVVIESVGSPSTDSH